MQFIGQLKTFAKRIRQGARSGGSKLGLLLEPAALALAAGLYAFNPLRYDDPVGFAGLYLLMTEQLGSPGLLPPGSIPFYGAGGLPFAYPPLAFYLARVAHDVLAIDLLTYARFAPAVLSIAALCLLYGFVNRLHGNRDSALVAALMAGMGANVYFAHGTAAGIVRGLALALGLATLLFAVGALRQRDKGDLAALVTGLFLGLTTLAHLSYAIFTGLGLLALIAFERKLPLRLTARRCAFIGAAAILVTAPWLSLVVSRHGWKPFAAAAGTHGTFDFWLQAEGSLSRFARLLGSWSLDLGRGWSPRVLAGLGLFGLGYNLWKGRWFLPAWLISTGAVLGEVSRYGEILGAMLAASALVSIVPLRETDGRIPIAARSLPRALMYLVVVGAVVYQGGRIISRHRPALTDPLREAAMWLRTESLPSAWFLLVPNDHNETEWLPYLARRNLAISHWGAEWTGDYNHQLRLQADLAECARRQSTACVEELLATLENPASCLVISMRMATMIEQFVIHPDWNQYFENDEYVVMGLDDRCASQRSSQGGERRAGNPEDALSLNAVSGEMRPGLRPAAPSAPRRSPGTSPRARILLLRGRWVQ